jgi:hypothetical protein
MAWKAGAFSFSRAGSRSQDLLKVQQGESAPRRRQFGRDEEVQFQNFMLSDHRNIKKYTLMVI